MNLRIQSAIILVAVIGFSHSMEVEQLLKSALREGIKSDKCSKSRTGYALMDSCGSYCKCIDGVLRYCEEKKCESKQELYLPVEAYEVDVEDYAGDRWESCRGKSHFYNGCNWCYCGPDGKLKSCTRRLCFRPVYRQKE